MRSLVIEVPRKGPNKVPIPVIKVPMETKAMMEMKIFDQKFGGPWAVATIDMK